jgi:hypothetical protein
MGPSKLATVTHRVSVLSKAHTLREQFNPVRDVHVKVAVVPMKLPAKHSPIDDDNDLLFAVANSNPRGSGGATSQMSPSLACFVARVTPRYENIEEIINDTFMAVSEERDEFSQSIACVHVDFWDCVSDGAQIAAAAEAPPDRAKCGRLS